MKTFRRILRSVVLVLVLASMALPVAAKAAQRGAVPAGRGLSPGNPGLLTVLEDLWAGIWSDLTGLTAFRAPATSSGATAIGPTDTTTTSTITCGIGCDESSGAIDPDG